jgi:mono/diheme cytochrome c family protein
MRALPVFCFTANERLSQPSQSSGQPTDVIQSNTVFGVSLKICLAVSLVSLATVGAAQKAQPPAGKVKQSATGDAARGKYIVEGIARCGQCHTPRDGSGNEEQTHALEGAAVWLVPAQPSSDWPLMAPRLAQTPPGTDAEMVKLLTTGVWRDGKYLRQPMPQFRMNTADAEAVVAYLKSMTSGSQQ